MTFCVVRMSGSFEVVVFVCTHHLDKLGSLEKSQANSNWKGAVVETHACGQIYVRAPIAQTEWADR